MICVADVINFKLNYKAEDFQLIVFKGKVLGILYDFEYEKK